jgi:hypothetical protein
MDYIHMGIHMWTGMMGNGRVGVMAKLVHTRLLLLESWYMASRRSRMSWKQGNTQGGRQRSEWARQ